MTATRKARLELRCKFCLHNHGRDVPAAWAAPQFDGGDEGEPCVWVPVCASHFENWYEGCEVRLPAFELTA